MLETMIAGGLRVAAMLLLMMGIVVALRGASAATRHAVWRAGFVVALVLPLVALTLPWKLEVLPAVAPELASAGPATPVSSSESDRLAPAPTWTPTDAQEAGASESTVPATLEGTRPDAASQSEPDTGGAGAAWPALLAVVWLAGALLLAARLVVGHVAVRRITRSGRRLTTTDWTAPLYEAADIVDVAVDVDLVQSDRVTMPFTAGVRHPVIVMPASAESWDLERRRAVLMHELAHVRRRDLIPHHVARWVCALHWFNPLAWLGARRMRAESERAADDLVLAAGTRASEYADHLLQIVSGAGRSMMPAPALPLAQRREFEGRMLAILEPGLRRRGPGRLQSVIVTALVLLVTLPLAALEREQPVSEWAAAQESSGAVAADTENDSDIDGDSEVEPTAPIGVETTPVEPTARVEQPKAPVGAAVARVPALIEALGDANVEVRHSVAMSLGELQDPRAVQALIRVLRADTVDEVRAAAARALGEIEDPAAVAALSHALRNDTCEEVRKNAAWALGQIEDAGAVEALGAALRDSNEEVRRTAVWALGEIESPNAVPMLVSALGSDDIEIRRTAVWALGQIEDPRAVPSLMPLVGDADIQVREAVVHALAQIEDPAAAPAMVRALSDRNPDIRTVAAMALGDMGLNAAPAPLVAALRDGNPDVRMSAAHALGEIADPASVSALTAALDDDNEDVRLAAIHALLEMDSQVATEALLELLRHDDPNVRKHAAELLGEQ